jgi:hypothetical protein
VSVIVVEAELVADLDGGDRDEQAGADDPAVRLAGVVHEIGGRERRHAHHVQLVVDLQRVRPPRFVERVELGAVDDVAAETGDGRLAGIAAAAKIPRPFAPADATDAFGLSQDCCTAPHLR